MTAAPPAEPAGRRASLLAQPLPVLPAWLQRDLGALAAYLLVTVALLYRMVLNLDRFAPDPGDPLLNSWIMAWDVHALGRGLQALFNAPIFFPYGLTLAYSETLLGNLPIAAPIIALTHNPLLACNVVVVLSFVLGGWCMYFTVSRLTGSGWAGLIAGMVFAFQLERFAALSHVQLLTTQWLPLVVYFLDRTLRTQHWRHWAGLLVFLNLEFLCGYNVGMFMMLLVALLVIGYLAAGLVRATPRLGAQAGALAVLTLALQVPLARPYFTLTRQMGLERRVEDLHALSGSPRDYLLSVPDHWLYGAFSQRLAPDPMVGGEHCLFLGAVAWLLVIGAVLGPLRARPAPRELIVFLAAMAVLIVLSWGPRLGGVPLPYALLFDHVPGFKSIRVPARMVIVVSVLVAMLGAYGARHWLERLGRYRRAIAPLLCLLVVAEAGPMQWTGVITPPPADGPGVYKWLAEQPADTVVLELPIHTHATLQAFTESTRQYYGTSHWRRTVNGYSGFLSHMYLALGAASQAFPNEDTWRWLQGLRVDYVIVHHDDYQDGEAPGLDAALPRWADRLRPAQEFDHDTVLQVALPPWNVGRAQPVFGRRLKLLGYAPPSPGGPCVLRLYWQALAPVGECVVMLSNGGVTDVRVPLEAGGLPPGQWHVGEVYVQEMRLSSLTATWSAADLTVALQGLPASPAIEADGQALTAVRLEGLH